MALQLDAKSLLLTEVTFQVSASFVDTVQGEWLGICGSARQLGEWNIHQAVPLSPLPGSTSTTANNSTCSTANDDVASSTASSETVWYSVTLSVPSEVPLSYKYVVLRGGGGKEGLSVRDWVEDVSSLKKHDVVDGLMDAVRTLEKIDPDSSVSMSSGKKSARESSLEASPVFADEKLRVAVVCWEGFHENRQLVPQGFHMVVDDGRFGTHALEETGVSHVLIDHGWLNDVVQCRIFVGDSEGVEETPGLAGTTLGVHMFDGSPSSRFTIEASPADPFTVVLDRTSDDCLVFDAPTVRDLCINIDVFEKVGTGPEIARRLVARAFVDSSELVQELRGQLCRPLISPETFAPIGTVDFRYLVITPLLHPRNNLSETFKVTWQEPLWIGHRGAGSSRNKPSATHKTIMQNHALTENTLLSFATAAQLGADYVEFDVQLTLDGIPVICHDEHVVITTYSHTGKPLKIQVPLSHLTFDELRQIRAEMPLKPRSLGAGYDDDAAVISAPNMQSSTMSLPSGAMRSGEDRTENNFPRTVSSSVLSSLAVSSRAFDAAEVRRANRLELKTSAFVEGISDSLPTLDFLDLERQVIFTQPAKTKAERHVDIGLLTPGGLRVESTHGASQVWRHLDTYPALKDLLLHLPPTLGFNVEIKYPKTAKMSAKLGTAERNRFVDAILTTLFDFTETRRIIISSFDPDICMLASLKQTRFPVFFLTDGKAKHLDKRRTSIAEAIRFCTGARLYGIVCEAGKLLEDLHMVEVAHQAGVLVFTYGDANMDERLVEQQKSAGVDAVIADQVFEVRKKHQKLGQDVYGKPRSEAKHNPHLGFTWIPQRMSKPPGRTRARSNSLAAPNHNNHGNYVNHVNHGAHGAREVHGSVSALGDKFPSG